MFRCHAFRALLFTTLCAVSGIVGATEDVAELLRRADALRLAATESKVEITVRLYKNDALDKEKSYTVYLKPGRRSLVLFRSSGEVGQKVLMLDNTYWMLLPGTRRPIRITPMQKLLGEASTGDVTTLTWSEDYIGKMVDKEYRGDPCTAECMLLELSSKRKDNSYQRIELWLDGDSVPLHARLYLKSGRLAKEASYHLGELNGNRQITAMTLSDSINTSRKTHIEYLSMEAISIPDKFYNPAFLLREDLKGW